LSKEPPLSLVPWSLAQSAMAKVFEEVPVQQQHLRPALPRSTYPLRSKINSGGVVMRNTINARVLDLWCWWWKVMCKL
jgi:hypothetical protein